MQESLLSRCGIYCGACYIYRAQRDCGEFIRKVATWQKVELEEIKCDGCFAEEENKWPNCRKCEPWKCLDQKGLDFCYQCDEFWENNCAYYQKLEDFCAERGENIRHNMVKTMADPQKYLKDQVEDWKCHSCGMPYSWYEENCHHCGKSLNRRHLSLSLDAHGIP